MTTARHTQAARLHQTAASKRAAARRDGSNGEDDLRWAGDKTRPGEAQWHVHIGQLVHRCAGELAEYRSEPRHVLAGRIIEWVNHHAASTRVFGNLPKARAQVTSMTGAYLFGYSPGPDAQYMGSEVAFEGGRLDLVWLVPELGVVIDELKTTAWVRLGVDASMLNQAQRYREHGVTEWGGAFAGVRFLPLLNPHEARFIDHTGTVTRLDASAAATVRERAA